jgi:hypothetical protein
LLASPPVARCLNSRPAAERHTLHKPGDYLEMQIAIF